MFLHHIGYIVKDIQKFEKNLLFEKKINEVFDTLQQSKLALYQNFSTCHIELIQPVNSLSPNFNFLEKYGEQYHHLCYAMQSKEEMHELTNNLQMIYIKGPLQAVLFENKEVYFYFQRNKQIIEFLIT